VEYEDIAEDAHAIGSREIFISLEPFSLSPFKKSKRRK
jgi:hypothetical protein